MGEQPRHLRSPEHSYTSPDISQVKIMMQSIAISLLLLLGVSFSSQCEISLKNVGHVAFNWTLEYAGNLEHESSLEPAAHDNWTCLCLPHDMKIIYKDFYCHYMNCIDNDQYEVEVTDYAIYRRGPRKCRDLCHLALIY